MNNDSFFDRYFLVVTAILTTLVMSVIWCSSLPLLVRNQLQLIVAILVIFLVLGLAIASNRPKEDNSLKVTVGFDHSRAAIIDELFAKSAAIWDVVEKRNQRPASQMVGGEIIFRCANMTDFAGEYKKLNFRS